MEDDGRRERARALNFMLKTTLARAQLPPKLVLERSKVDHTVDLFAANEAHAPLRVFFRARKHYNTLALARNMGSACC